MYASYKLSKNGPFFSGPLGRFHIVSYLRLSPMLLALIDSISTRR